MTDPITDMLNRIMNAQKVQKAEIELPFSDLKNNIAEVLEKKGFVEKLEKFNKNGKKMLKITLKYNSDPENAGRKSPAILGMKRISKPGQRIYSKFSQLKPVRDGFGIAIVTTPKGILSDDEARKQKIGGELICHVW